VNRTDLQRLARTRIRDAEVLLGAGQWSGAYYLAGYAVECALKACIAKQTGLHDFPDKDRVLKSYSHRVESLVELADLTSQLDDALRADSTFKQNWSFVKDWNEQSRYQERTEAKARQLFDAISHPTRGVLSWIKGHW